MTFMPEALVPPCIELRICCWQVRSFRYNGAFEAVKEALRGIFRQCQSEVALHKRRNPVS